jgi:DNA-binding CsgD family transcriptional regulator
MADCEDRSQVWLSSLLECLPLAAVIADGEGAIVLANAKARNTLETDGALLIDNGRIRMRCRMLNPKFCGLLRGALHSAGQSIVMGVPKAADGGMWLVQVKSLLHSSTDAGTSLVSWFDPASSPTFDWNVLEEVYGLSRSEARVAALLAGGDDLVGAAGRLGIQLDTARTHLKSTFRKMHLHRQQELVRITTMLSFFC